MKGEENICGKVAIVTGAGRGIGREIAIALTARGALVALAARSIDELKETKARIDGASGVAEVFAFDITSEDEVQSLVSRVVDKFGTLDIVINNAGLVRTVPLAETSRQDWDDIMAVNARGPFLVCREALPHLRQQARSWIINIASVLAFKGYEGQGAYSASKHALLGFSRTLAGEEHENGVRVHVIYPGGTDTGMRFDDDRLPLIRPEAVAEAVVYLLALSKTCAIDEIYVRRENTTPFC